MNKFKKIAPETSEIKKELPFRVPEHYFDDFSARLQMRLKADTHAIPPPRNRFIRYLKPALGLAASFALVFMLVYWPVKEFLPGYLAKSSVVIETTEDDDHYFTYLENLDENSFFALVTDPANEMEGVNGSLDDDELMNYLSDNVSEYELFAQIQN
jgi:hypothetical protein